MLGRMKTIQMPMMGPSICPRPPTTTAKKKTKESSTLKPCGLTKETAGR